MPSRRSVLRLGVLGAGAALLATKLEAAEPVKEPLWGHLPLDGNGHDGQGAAPTLTWYLPKAYKHILVVCPGGGYRRQANHEGHDIALWLNELGYGAVVVHYTVSPKQYFRPYQDAARAIQLARTKAENGKVGIIGFSAGGHLACSVSVQPSLLETHWWPKEAVDTKGKDLSHRPDFTILGYPVISFLEHAHLGSVQALLNLEPQAIDQPKVLEIRQDLSLERQVKAGAPPLFIWHTADDPGVPAANSMMLATAWQAAKSPCSLHVYPKGRHGLGLAKNTPEVQSWTKLAADWLNQTLQ